MTVRRRLSSAMRNDNNAAFTMLDSGASSASNFALGALVALRSSSEMYGRFALAFALYSLTFGVWRAWGTEPFLLSTRKDRLRFGSVITGCSIIGAAAMIIGIALAVNMPNETRNLFLVVAFCLPLLAAHDGARFCLIGSGRSHRALVVDLLWLALMLTGSLAIDSPAGLIAWWGISGAATLILGLRLLAWPNLRGGLGWLHSTKQIGVPFILEFLVVTGSNSLIMLAVGYSSGLAEIGAYRGAAVLVGPVAVVMMGLVTIVLNVDTSRSGEQQRKTRRRVQTLTALSFAVGIGWALVTWATPDVVGQQVLGETWAASQRAAVWFSLAIGGQSAILVATAGYRLLGKVRKGAVVKAVAMLAVTISGVSASFVGGAVGAAAGFAAMSTTGGVLALLLFRSEAATDEPSGLVPVNVGLPLDKPETLV